MLKKNNLYTQDLLIITKVIFKSKDIILSRWLRKNK